MKKKLLHYLTRCISRQITTIYLSLSLLIILIMSMIFFTFMPKIFLDNYLTAVNNATTTTANELSYTISNADVSISALTAFNETFFTTITTHQDTAKEGNALYTSALTMLEESLDPSMPEIGYDFKAILYLDSELPLTRFFSNHSSPIPLDTFITNSAILSSEIFTEDEPWFKLSGNLSESFYWFTDETGRYLYGTKKLTHTEVKTITNITVTDIGTLVIRLDPQYFLEKIQSTIIGTKNSVVTLKLSDSELPLNTATPDYKYYSHEVSLPIGIHVLIQTPKQDINQLSHTYTYTLLLFVAGILLSTIFLVRYISKSVTNPITALSAHMDNSPALTPIHVDGLADNEIKNIYETYNNMLDKIQILVTEVETETAKRKDQEFATYQLQINPHFLYNTLNTLACHMMLKEDHTMVDALNILADHLRYNYKEPNAEVTIKEELSQLCNYVQIQNIQYQDRIILITDIPDEHLTFSVCKMILQPLVENAISYELGRFDDESIQIRIFSYTEGDILKLCVGNDMICEDVDLINDHIAGKINISKHSGGLGTRNINDRLKLKYGPEYGLNFYTTDAETVACLTLPLR